MIKIIELTEEELNNNFESYISTIENLKWIKDSNKETIQRYFKNIINNSKIFIAKKDNSIIWSLTAIIEYKLIRGWVKACRIEDVVVKKWYEWLWIWRMLIKKALEYWNQESVYKFTLSWSDEVAWFYEKNGFTKSSINFKKYIKK